MKVRDLGAWRTLGCGLQWKTGSRFPILFQVGKLLQVYYGPLGRRWHFSAISIYILYTQLTDLGLQKKIQNAYQETFQFGFSTCFGTCWATVAYKFILQISNDVSLFLPFNIAEVLKSRSTIWINSFPPPFSTLTIPFMEEKISPNSSIYVSTSLLIWRTEQTMD